MGPLSRKELSSARSQVESCRYLCLDALAKSRLAFVSGKEVNTNTALELRAYTPSREHTAGPFQGLARQCLRHPEVATFRR